MKNTGLTVVQQRTNVGGVPVGKKHFKRNFLPKMVNEDPAELMQVLVVLSEDTQTKFRSCVHLPFPACPTSFAQSHLLSHTKLLFITTLWWSER